MSILKIIKNGDTVSIPFDAPVRLSEVLEKNGYLVPHPCGGRGVCGKCAVDISGKISDLTGEQTVGGKRLSCKTVLLGDAVLNLCEGEKMEVETGEKLTRIRDNATSDRIGMAVDIGTTTLVLKLFDLESGDLVGMSSRANSQRSVAADVMGRIDAAVSGKLSLLSDMIKKEIEEMISEALGGKSVGIEKAVITGNTAMLYLLTQREPISLSKAPFVADCLFDLDCVLFNTDTYLPPCINAFVGADLSCALLISGMMEKGETSFLCDIGTNGELALYKDGVFYVTSTAAGPAFEGVGITQGSVGKSGAVERVYITEGGKIGISVIGDTQAESICGSGIIDAVATGLKLGVIDETGRMEEPISLAPRVSLMPGDVRAVQTAKAAIAAGIQTLLSVSDTTVDQVKTCYLAGGFGKKLSIENVTAIGLLPPQWANSTVAIGNAAIDGASAVLRSERSREVLKRIAAISKHVSLGGNPIFNEAFIDCMCFE